MANPSIEWTKVLLHPLGLAGYALFLLFGLLARVKRRDERRWILPAALLAAGVALFGGLGLAYRDADHKARETTISQPVTIQTPASKQQNTHVSQTSSGGNSPNVQGVQGDVNVTYGDNAQPQAPSSHKKQLSRKPGTTAQNDP